MAIPYSYVKKKKPFSNKKIKIVYYKLYLLTVFNCGLALNLEETKQLLLVRYNTCITHSRLVHYEAPTKHALHI